MVTTSQLYTCRAGSTLVKEKKNQKKYKKINIKKKKKVSGPGLSRRGFSESNARTRKMGHAHTRARRSVASFYIYFTLFIPRERPIGAKN
jgi:hypothetical protein